MNPDALLVQALLSTCRQVRRLNPDPDVAAAALKRERALARELERLLPDAAPVANVSPEADAGPEAA